MADRGDTPDVEMGAHCRDGVDQIYIFYQPLIDGLLSVVSFTICVNYM